MTDVGVQNGKIVQIGKLSTAKAKKVIDAKGLYVLPGAIDTQVHFREPGLEHKEDLATGTKSAALGGITTIFEMPNTNPQTITAEAINTKLKLAHGRAWVNFGFFIGAAKENAKKLAELERLPGCVGVKLFMGTSTGSLLVKADEDILEVFKNGTRRVAIHSEDEYRLIERKKLLGDHPAVQMHPEWRDAESAFLATRRVVALARKANRLIHVLHITTAEEIKFLHENKDIASVECTPQHLTLFA
ncbi:MAG: dihydroorotase, partial [Candidatus Omnitrophica bacterium CG11_big_fil_rev_8_21_14_0_20_63_9]